MRNRQIARRAVLVLAAITSLPPITARAASTSWTFNGNGNWTTSSDWSGGVPAGGSDVFIRANTVTYDYAGASIQFNGMTVDNPSTGSFAVSATFSQSTNTFNSSVETIGDAGRGFWSLSGGTHNVTAPGVAGLAFGSLAGGRGIGTLTGGTLNAAPGEIFAGYHGAGTFTQSGGQLFALYMTMGWQSDGVGTYNLNAGSANLSGGLFVGYNGNGTINLSGGTLNAVSEDVGSSGTGLFNQTAGVNVVPSGGELVVGNTGLGTYLLSGTGSLSVGAIEYVGSTGSGTFNQSGGTQTVGAVAAPGTLDMGKNFGSIGSYSFSGGALTVNGTEIVGDAGTATLNQSGGVHTIGSATTAGSLLVGNSSGGAGTYLLSGTGSLTLNGIEAVGVRGSGTFNQSGGAQTIGSIAAAGSIDIGQASGGIGNYFLSAGSLTVNGTEIVGDLGSGTFTQSSGVHIVAPAFYAPLTIGASRLNANSFGQGTYLLSGTGSLAVSGSEIVGLNGSGTFIQSGGSQSVAIGLGSISVGDGVGGVGYYALSGGTLTLPTIEYIGFSGNGTFNQSGGTQTIQGSPGSFGQLDVGVQPNATGTYQLSGTGFLLVTGSEFIGLSGTGTFIQTGGTNDVGTPAHPGTVETSNGGLGGTYLMSGGTLSVSGSEIAGDGIGGIINQSGGTNIVGSATLSGSIIVAEFSPSSGTFLLSNTGSLVLFGTETVGQNGAGTFSQSGGAQTIGTALNPGTLLLGEGLSATGTYLLSGGALTVFGNETIGQDGVGTFIQSGGVHTIGSAAAPGTIAVANSQYALSGTGVLNVNGTEVIGAAANTLATFDQEGGTHNVGSATAAGTLQIERFGHLSLNGGTLTVLTNEYIGGGVPAGGSVNQEGGINVIGTPTTPGTLQLNNGGIYVLGFGSLTLDGSEIIGGDGPASFEQMGGAHTVGTTTNSTFYLGYNGPSTYKLSDGSLTVSGTEYVGIAGTGTSTFTQTGGTHLVTAAFGNGLLDIGGYDSFASGVYQLNDGSLTVNGSVEIGGNVLGPSGKGILNIPGGSMSVSNTLTVWDSASTALNLSGGALTVDTLNTDNNPSRFNWTAGTLTVTGGNGLTIGNTGPLGLSVTLNSLHALRVNQFTSISPLGQITLNGGTFSTGGLIGSGHLNINSGTFQATNSNIFVSPGSPLGNTLQLNAGANIVVSGNGDALVVDVAGGLLQLNGGAVFVTGANGYFGNAGQTILSSPLSLISGIAAENAGLLSGTGRINAPLINFAPSGIVSVGASDTLLFQAVGNSNASRFTLGGGTIQFTADLVNTGSISGAGSLFVGTLTNNGTISALTTISVGSFSNAGTVQLTGAPTSVFGPVSNTGRILITGGSTTTFFGDVNTSTGSISVGTNSTAVFFGNVTGQSHFFGAGIKDFEGAVSGGPIASIVGDTYVGTPANVTTQFFNEDDLSISGNAVVATDPGSGTLNRVHTLEFVDNGKLDLNNNDLLIDYTGASPLATVLSEIKTGYANGAWTGNQLTSTAAHAASLTSHLTALGYAEASTLGVSIFDGQSVDGSAIVIRYTYSGDANLDGVVNALDFNALATNFGAASGRFWPQGDFNYDGIVNTADFTALATNFDQAMASPSLATTVPEPDLIGAGLIIAAVSRRRRTG